MNKFASSFVVYHRSWYGFSKELISFHYDLLGCILHSDSPMSIFGGTTSIAFHIRTRQRCERLPNRKLNDTKAKAKTKSEIAKLNCLFAGNNFFPSYFLVPVSPAPTFRIRHRRQRSNAISCQTNFRRCLLCTYRTRVCWMYTEYGYRQRHIWLVRADWAPYAEPEPETLIWPFEITSFSVGNMFFFFSSLSFGNCERLKRQQYHQLPSQQHTNQMNWQPTNERKKKNETHKLCVCVLCVRVWKNRT